MLEAEMERHFANWGDGQEIDVQRARPLAGGHRRVPRGAVALQLPLERQPARCAARPGSRCRSGTFPTRRISSSGRELIEAGYAKVFHPGARVLHSHDFPPRRFFRRYFDEFRGLREVLGYREPAGRRRDVALLPKPRRGGPPVAARARGSRHDLSPGSSRAPDATTPPAWLERSSAPARAPCLHGSGASSRSRGERASTPVEVPGRSPTASENRRASTSAAGAGSSFARRAAGQGRDRAAPAGRSSGAAHARLGDPTLAGGLGRPCRNLPADPRARGARTQLRRLRLRPVPLRRSSGARASRRDSRELRPALDAEVFVGFEDFDSADVAVATSWWTAYPVRDLPRCKEKVYLVQDHESEFYPTSVESLWAEQTYAMGYRCLAYTPWLAGVLRDRYGLEVAQFDMGTDLETYAPGAPEERESRPDRRVRDGARPAGERSSLRSRGWRRSASGDSTTASSSSARTSRRRCRSRARTSASSRRRSLRRSTGERASASSSR